MEHSFDIKIAKEYGVIEAIILKNIYFWVKKNALNKANAHDGRYWTYNSVKAFCGLFPYLNERQIKYSLKKLKDCGLIASGNYNNDKRLRTLWYTLTDKALNLLGENIEDFIADGSEDNEDAAESAEPGKDGADGAETESTNLSNAKDKNVLCKVQNCTIGTDKNVKCESTNLSVALDKIVQCTYTDINTDVKPDINTDNARAREAVMQPIPFTPPAELDRQKRLDMHTLPPDTQKAEEWFERFWAAYPKKQNKTLARLAWLRLPYNTGLYDKICETVQRWSATRRDWRTEGGRYVPMPENFLNDGRWEDEPPTQTFDGPMDIASMAAMIMAEGDVQSADRERYNQGFCDMERRRLDAAEGGGQGGIPDDCPIDVEAIRTA